MCLTMFSELHCSLPIAITKTININLMSNLCRFIFVVTLGRILNRFSTDLDAIDGSLPEFLHYLLQNAFQVASILVVCLASSPYFVIMMVPLGLLFAYIFGYFRKVSREVKRLNSVSRSPVFSLFTEMLNGISTLRAFRREDGLQQQLNERVDVNTRFLFIYWAMSRWLALRLDVLAVSVVVIIAFLAVMISVFGNGKVDPNMLGLAIVNALQMTTLLQWMVRSGIDTENNMTSVERLLAFSKIEPEAPLICDCDPVDSWPSQGTIVFRNVHMRYRPGLSLVLKGLNLSVPAHAKVGFVGRTGE
jgi:ATP-binding cassette, subfamily C (CFTR/MRP), member 1